MTGYYQLHRATQCVNLETESRVIVVEESVLFIFHIPVSGPAHISWSQFIKSRNNVS